MAETSPEGVEQNGEIHAATQAKEMLKNDPCGKLKDCESQTRCLETMALVSLVNGTRENGTTDLVEKQAIKVETNGMTEVSHDIHGYLLAPLFKGLLGCFLGVIGNGQSLHQAITIQLVGTRNLPCRKLNDGRMGK